MNLKKLNKTLIFFLFAFSIYCALTIGQTWDEAFHLKQGKITLDYLFSLGTINDEELFYRRFYSPMYWSLQYFFTKIFPLQYQIETSHLLNVLISLGTVLGLGKLSKELFNRKVGKLAFLILFFYPVFFGHMGFNASDTILAFGHVWIFYYVIKYLKKQNNREKIQNYILCIAILAAAATGVQLVFLGSLIPVFIFVFLDIFFTKKFIAKKFNKQVFFYDFFKCFLIFYLLLALFWIDTHSNIFVMPFKIVLETFSSSFWTGWPYNLLNGEYFFTNETPKTYLIISLFYKTPEYFLLTYLLFIILLFSTKKYFNNKFEFFYFKIILLFTIIILPHIVLFIIPYAIYDGVRLFLWSTPYLCIIPALTIYYLIEKINFIKAKITLIFLSLLIIYFLYNFFVLTPYQYTYLNLMSGKTETRYKKFENDYWGSSLKELIKYSQFDKKQTILIATCGVSPEISEDYFNKYGYFNFKFVKSNEAEYIIMTNRTEFDEINNKVVNCFDKFTGKDVSVVQRNGLALSVIRKI